MNLVDMDYKRALTKYSEAQAKAAGVGKPMSAADMAYRTMVNPEASAADRKLATAFLMRESPELYAQIVQDMDFQSVLGAAGNGNGNGDAVPDKLVPAVDRSRSKITRMKTVINSVVLL